MPKPKRPKDINQKAKLIIEIATGERIQDKHKILKKPKGQSGGLKGGKARAEALTPKKRKEIAVKASKKRWNKD